MSVLATSTTFHTAASDVTGMVRLLYLNLTSPYAELASYAKKSIRCGKVIDVP